MIRKAKPLKGGRPRLRLRTTSAEYFYDILYKTFRDILYTLPADDQGRFYRFCALRVRRTDAPQVLKARATEFCGRTFLRSPLGRIRSRGLAQEGAETKRDN